MPPHRTEADQNHVGDCYCPDGRAESAAFTRDDAWDCDVLVVGGGLVCLAASMFLAQQGLRVWGRKPRAPTSSHPKLCGVSARTMELYRSAGIEEAVRA